MARSAVRQSARRGFRDINLTPLVDVMLVLLMVFMITAPLLTSGIDVDLPNVSAAPAPIHDARLVVSVTADERIVFDDRDVTANIEAALLEDERVRAVRAIYIRADENARYGVVARVVAAARAAGVDALNLVVETEER